MSTEIATTTGTAPAVADDSAGLDRLIESAIAANLDVDSLERLLAMRERHEAQIARREFFRALSEFQRRCPPIVKRKRADRYSYAPLADIVAQVRDLEAECGLSHRFDSIEGPDGSLAVTCTVTHTLGHSETTTHAIPATQGVRTNSAQDRGIMSTYGQRYAYCGALGITTADEDMDARLPRAPVSDETISEELLADLRALAEEVGADESAIAKWARVERLEDLPARAYQRAVGILEAKRGQA